MEDYLKMFKEIKEIQEFIGWTDNHLYEVLAETKIIDEGLEFDGDNVSSRTIATIKKQFQRKAKSTPLEYYIKILAGNSEVTRKLGVKPVLLECDLDPELLKSLKKISESLTNDLMNAGEE